MRRVTAAVLLALASCGGESGPAPVTVYYPAGCAIAESIPPPARPETDLDPETLKRARAQPHSTISGASLTSMTWSRFFEQARNAARGRGCDAILLEKWEASDRGDSKPVPESSGKAIEYRAFRATGP